MINLKEDLLTLVLLYKLKKKNNFMRNNVSSTFISFYFVPLNPYVFSQQNIYYFKISRKFSKNLNTNEKLLPRIITKLRKDSRQIYPCTCKLFIYFMLHE